jgi:hypothetical protein
MANIKLYWFDGSSWVKSSDSSDSSGSPVSFGVVNAGGLSANRRLRVSLTSGYQTISISPYDNIRISASGAYPNWYQFTYDVSGSPSGAWLPLGQSYNIPVGEEIEPDNPHYLWVRASVPLSASSSNNQNDTKIHLSSFLTSDFEISSVLPTADTPSLPNSSLYVTFNKSIDATTSAGKFSLTKDSNSSAVAHSATLSGDSMVIIDPTASALPSGGYTLTVLGTLKDYEGCSLSRSGARTVAWLVGDGNVPPVYSIAATIPTSATFSVSGAYVSGTQAGDAVTTLSIAWTSGSQNPASMSESQRVHLTGAAINTFTSATYTINPGYGLDGITWTPWVRATETTSAGTVQSGEWSSGASVYMADVNPPSVVTGVSAVPTGTTSMRLSWSPATDNIGVTSYEYYLNNTGVAPALSATPTLSGVTATSAAITGMTSLTNYAFWVKARDAAGNGSPSWSTVVSGETNASIGTVSGVTLSALGYYSGALTWSSVANASRYELYQSTSSARPSNSATFTSSGTALSAAVNDLSGNTSYYWWVRAVNNTSGAGAWSSVVSGVTALSSPLVIQLNESGMEDTMLHGAPGNENTNYATGVSYSIGDSYSNYSTSQRVLCRFPIPAELSGKTITGVTLSFFGNGYTSAGGLDPVEVNVYRVLKPWTESGATWNKYNSTTNWATSGCSAAGDDRASTPSCTSSIAVATTGFWSVGSSAGLIQDVTDWVNNTATNNGWLIQSTGEYAGVSTVSRRDIASSNDTTQARRPKLTITYI